MVQSWQRGLYAITDPDLIPPRELTRQLTAALIGGAALIQYRDKHSDTSERLARARAALACCRTYGVPLIINDDVELTAASGADGVHLGADDIPPSEARLILGPRAIIGVSCYNLLPRALNAEAAGADYVAFGRFFPSQTKPHAVQADLELLRLATRTLNIPIAAIGGITADNGRRLIQAGADLLAVIHGVFGQADVTIAARRMASLFADEDENLRTTAVGI